MKILITLLLIITSFTGKSQLRLIFFSDVPPLHRIELADLLLEKVPIYFDSITTLGLKSVPQTFCRIHNSHNVLEFIDAINRPDKYTLGITYRKLSYECRDFGLHGFTHNNTSVVSLYFLGNYDRTVKVALHEVGHLYGLKHCPNRGCLMEKGGKDDLGDIDREGDFCDECRLKIKRLDTQRL